MPRAPAPYEVFLVFENAAADAETLYESASTLHTNAATARLLGVDLYYRADHDVMMLGLRFDPHAASGPLLDRVREDADRAGASVLELPRLPEEDRRRFVDEYLPGFPLRVRGLPTPADAVGVFARDVGLPVFAASPSASGRRAAGSGEHSLPGLEVHYARGDGWQLGRARNLTREGVYVIASATPRQGDIVEVRLASNGTTLAARGQVVYVTPEHATEALGASGFGVRFLLGTGEERQLLERLVHATLGQGYASIRSAPSRRDQRYPVRWPVTLDVGHASAALAALDVSSRGMFVACSPAQLPSRVDLSFAVDDPGGMIRAAARVARTVSPQIARARGVTTGYGLELLSLSTSDEARFRMFVARVGRRSEKSVLVAAGSGRVTDLAAELTAAGYAATSVNDAALAVQRCSQARPPDLVMVDRSLERDHTVEVRQLRRSLARMDVPVCFLEGEEPAGCVRALADATLLA